MYSISIIQLRTVDATFTLFGICGAIPVIQNLTSVMCQKSKANVESGHLMVAFLVVFLSLYRLLEYIAIPNGEFT